MASNNLKWAIVKAASRLYKDANPYNEGGKALRVATGHLGFDSISPEASDADLREVLKAINSVDFFSSPDDLKAVATKIDSISIGS